MRVSRGGAGRAGGRTGIHSGRCSRGWPAGSRLGGVGRGGAGVFGSTSQAVGDSARGVLDAVWAGAGAEMSDTDVL